MSLDKFLAKEEKRVDRLIAELWDKSVAVKSLNTQKMLITALKEAKEVISEDSIFDSDSLRYQWLEKWDKEFSDS